MPIPFTPPLMEPFRRLVATLLAVLETRLGVLSLDVREAVATILVALLLTGLACLCFTLAIVLLAFFVVAVFWDSYRLLSLTVLIVVLLLGGAGFWLAVRRQVEAMADLFMGTRAELAKDFEMLAHARARSSQRGA